MSKGSSGLEKCKRLDMEEDKRFIEKEIIGDRDSIKFILTVTIM